MIRKLPLRLIFAALIFFMSLPTISAQVSLREISLKEQIDKSSLVVEGQVVSQRSFWDAEHKSIYTAYTVNIYKVFKGEPVSQIEVLTLGGMVGLKGLFVSHVLKLGKGSTGIFTLYDSNFNIGSKNKTKNKQFKAYSGIQGFYTYNIKEDVVLNPFSKRNGIKLSMYKDVLDITKVNYRTIAVFDLESLQKKSIQKNNSRPPSGITFTPTTVTAGTGSVLTISGSGFGATQGKVGFRNSDDGGGSFFDALDSQVLSWTDNLITVEVPVIGSSNSSINGTAGTGNIRVTDSGGAIDTSSSVLTVTYSQVNGSGDFGEGFKSYQTQHHNDNGSGGYTWIMEEDFFNETTHTDAPDAFLRAFDSWRCETKVKWEISGSSTTTSVITTTENIIAFDEDGTSSELPAGVLGTCYFGFSGSNCTSGIVFYVTDLDIVFDRETNWYFGVGTIANAEFDFETVALHELGHGHQLGHVINTSNVMHFSVSNGTINTILDANSIAAANDVHSRSTFSHNCSPAISPMTDYTGSCGLSVVDNSIDNGITLYPNPTKQQFFIKSKVVNLDKVEIYDISGRLISQIDVSDSSITIPVNLRGVSKGVYFVNIHSGTKFLTKKLVVE